MFSGWTPAAQSTGTSVFGLHHPDGYSRPTSSHTYEGPVAVLRTRMTIASYRVGKRLWNWLDDWSNRARIQWIRPCGTSSHQLVGLEVAALMHVHPNGYTIYSKFANFYPQIRQYICSLTPSSPIANPATFVASHSFRANWRSVTAQPVIGWMWPPTIRLPIM